MITQLCRSSSETVRHLFYGCSLALTLYGLVASTLHISKPLYCPESQWTVILHNAHTKTEKATLLVTQFVLWRERCSRIFRETSKETQELVYEVLQELRYQASVTKETSWEFLTYVVCFNFKSVSFLLLFSFFHSSNFMSYFSKFYLYVTNNLWPLQLI